MYVHTKFAIIVAAETFIWLNFFDKNMLACIRKKFKYFHSYLFFT